MDKVKPTTEKGRPTDPQQKSIIEFKNSDGTHHFKRKQIISIQAFSSQICVHTISRLTGAGKTIVSQTLDATEEQLNYFPFTRVHRSWMVNMKKVVLLKGKAYTSLITTTGMEIPVSKQYRKNLKVMYDSMINPDSTAE